MNDCKPASQAETSHRLAFRGEVVGFVPLLNHCAVRQPAASRTLRAAQERLQAQSLTRLSVTRRVESRRRDEEQAVPAPNKEHGQKGKGWATVPRESQRRQASRTSSTTRMPPPP